MKSGCNAHSDATLSRGLGGGEVLFRMVRNGKTCERLVKRTTAGAPVCGILYVEPGGEFPFCTEVRAVELREGGVAVRRVAPSLGNGVGPTRVTNSIHGRRNTFILPVEVLSQK